MLPDKKSNSFTWLQGTKRITSDTTKIDKTALHNDMDMEVDVDPITASSSCSDTNDFSKENKQQRRKRMTRMGASSFQNFQNVRNYNDLMRRTSTGRAYLYMEQDDLAEEDEEEAPNTSGGSKDSMASSSLTQKFNKTFKDVKTSIGNLSQRLRRSARRRYALGETTSMVDISPTRRILGRTPTKLYSPFSFDSPASGKSPLTRQQLRRLDSHTPTTPVMSRRTSLEPGKFLQTRMGLRDLKNSEVNRQSFRF